MRALKAPLAALAAAVIIALLAACGDDDDYLAKDEGPPVNELPAGERVARLDRIAKATEPTYVTQPPRVKDQIFITTKYGHVIVLEDGEKQAEPFLDLIDRVNDEGSEQGLVGLAFAPDYGQSGLFYVAYNLDDNSVQIDEFRRSDDDPLLADPASRRPILNAPHGAGERDQHNGGQLQFGPDGFLYIGLGEGGPVRKDFVSNRAQQRSVLLGKILRIDPRPSGDEPYTVPDDNPYVGREKQRPEIYAYGLRNPYRFSFDRETGAMAIADPGADDVEELNFVERDQGVGRNFGWPRFEGDQPFRTDYELEPGGRLTEPIHTYPHDQGCSIIGGYVVRDPRIPELNGRYLYGDACSGELRSLLPFPDRAVDDRTEGMRLSPARTFGLVSFGEGADGRIFAASFTGGVYALNPEH